MNNKGFTLIELLVVVLIIGILAAVALPQYTKAVEKARTAEALTLMGDVMTAQRIFLLGNSACATDLRALDIEIPGISDATHASGTHFNYELNGCAITATRTNSAANAGYNMVFTLNPANGQIQKACNNTGSTDVCTAIRNSGGWVQPAS